MIEADNVWYSYSERAILKGASLSIGNGITVLVGPNGAGKTTLLKVMAGIYRLDSGRIFIDGEDLWACPPSHRVELRRKVVYVHEKPIILRGSVFFNVCYGLMLRNLDRKEVQKKALEIMEKLGIKALAWKNARELSAGQAQLMVLARALAVKPKYLLLDEPLANLDKKNRELVLRLLEELKDRGVGIAVATHDRLLALRIADKIALIEEGCIVVEGPPEKLKDYL